MSAEYVAKSIPAGYKQTEVGVIPVDWSSICYADYLNIISGLGFKKAEYCDVGIRLLRIDNVSYGQISWDSIAYLPFQYAEKFPNLVLLEGDILLALNRPITNNQLKLARLGSEDSPAILYQRVGKINVINSKLDKRFAYFVLRKFIRKFVEDTSVGSDQPFVSTTALKLIPLPLPPTLAEQEAIATALSDTDALIESLEQLIAKKRQIKQGAMQELLTGKRRLPGFSGEWELKNFDNVLERVNVKSHQIQVSEYQMAGKYPIIDQGKEFIVGFSDRHDKYFQCPEDGVIVFGDHTCIIKFVDFNFLVGADGTQVLKAKNGQCTSFLAFQLDFKGIVPTGYNRHFKLLKERDFIIPYFEEQTAIATILSDMDAEITTLEEKISKTRQIKQGMMQELLTGRIRLV